MFDRVLDSIVVTWLMSDGIVLQIDLFQMRQPSKVVELIQGADVITFHI